MHKSRPQRGGFTGDTEDGYATTFFGLPPLRFAGAGSMPEDTTGGGGSSTGAARPLLA